MRRVAASRRHTTWAVCEHVEQGKQTTPSTCLVPLSGASWERERVRGREREREREREIEREGKRYISCYYCL